VAQSIVIFVHQYQADAMEVAAVYGVPVELVLGLSGNEGQWGTSRFAAANNFFGLHAPIAGDSGEMLSKKKSLQANGKYDYTRVATFNSFKDGLKAMFERHPDLHNITDPKAFARQAQMGSGHWGWLPATDGAKARPDPAYQGKIVNAIESVQRVLREGK
jgi:flagellum-specific peptidoglycan hydrolase FlgJ